MIFRWCLVAVCMLQIAAASDDRTSLAIEALLRLDATNLHDNPKLAQAVTNLLAKTRGTPNFVRLVQRFHVTNQTEGLLEVIARDNARETGVQAMQLILALGDLPAIHQSLNSTNVASASKTVEALGNTGKKEAVPLLLPIVTNPERDVALRKQAARSLSQIHDGAAALLALARDGKLPEDLAFTASSELNRAQWPDVKAEAAALLPLPRGQDSRPLPPVADLVRMRGDPAAGARVFATPTVACSTCHRVRGEGAEVGPDLSEIGTKLGKDALYESILDPNAGISFGYEAWQLTLKSGDEAYGLIVSETADELALKAANGVVTRFEKSDIAKREQMKLSIMPVGLQQAMSVQELVDLVEYLASLRKAAN